MNNINGRLNQLDACRQVYRNGAIEHYIKFIQDNKNELIETIHILITCQTIEKGVMQNEEDMVNFMNQPVSSCWDGELAFFVADLVYLELGFGNPTRKDCMKAWIDHSASV
jgi:hypothetical protein